MLFFFTKTYKVWFINEQKNLSKNFIADLVRSLIFFFISTHYRITRISCNVNIIYVGGCHSSFSEHWSLVYQIKKKSSIQHNQWIQSRKIFIDFVKKKILEINQPLSWESFTAFFFNRTFFLIYKKKITSLWQCFDSVFIFSFVI